MEITRWLLWSTWSASHFATNEIGLHRMYFEYRPTAHNLEFTFYFERQGITYRLDVTSWMIDDGDVFLNTLYAAWDAMREEFNLNETEETLDEGSEETL